MDKIERNYGEYSGSVVASFILFMCTIGAIVAASSPLTDSKPTKIIFGIAAGVLGVISIFLWFRAKYLHAMQIQAAEEERLKKRREEIARMRQKEEEEAKARRSQKELLLKADIIQIDKMNGKTFEEYVCVLYNKLGYETKQTRLSGDYGADIIAVKDNIKTIIQTKRSINKIIRI